MPDGSFQTFEIQHSPIIEAGLAAKFPELAATYTARGIDDPTATARLDLLPSGFHAMILSTKGTTLIDPYQPDDTENYLVYYKRDFPKRGDWTCDFGKESAELRLTEGFDIQNFIPEVSPEVTSGTTLRQYRLALAADYEYCQAVGGGTVSGCLAAQVLIMNRVNGVYERDLAIRMNMIANNDKIVYAAASTNCGGSACTASNDPYTNSNGSTMLTENTNNLNSTIGTANFDIGHVFSTGGGGVAVLNGPCGTNRSRGVTGQSNPIGDPFAIDYVAHEMGHQWGADHTFNSTTGSCGGGNRGAGSAYEPGSGITIMAYAGICGNQDLAPHSIDTFHVKSLEAIVAYSQTGNGNSCAVSSATGNTPPNVSVVGGTSFNIPKQTPFTLTATGSDQDGDTLTYDWEEYDLGASTTAVPNTDSDGARPIFRPFSPTAGPSRTFPAIEHILNRANVPPSTTNGYLTGELLPAIARTMTFQVVARDNRPNGGGIKTATATVVLSASGPFKVTAPNTSATVNGGSTMNVTWDVAGTTASPISAANVKISLSTDGGMTFPTVLSASTPNDGSESVTIPNTATTQARIKVEAVGNIFFDINDANFTINASAVTGHAVADLDGDGRSDVAVWRPSDGVWYSLNSSDNTFVAVQFGTNGDAIVPGDYDGDGKTDRAVFRPSTGTWYILGSTSGFSAIQFGLSDDLPAQADFDGDGKADVAVFRPSTGVWYLQRSTEGFTAMQFGMNGDRPVAADYDGDGKADAAVFRPSTGTWFMLNSTSGFSAVAFGTGTDKVVPGDYDGDGKAEPTVFRGSDSTWYQLRSTAGFGAVTFGSSGDTPAVGDFDGDHRSDVSVFRSSAGSWFRLNSSNGSFVAVGFGSPGDKPVESGYYPIQ